VAAGEPADRGADLRSLIGYAVIYTVWLKRATPQNIVIGGAAGAAPPGARLGGRHGQRSIRTRCCCS
jgi:hypothetical protein